MNGDGILNVIFHGTFLFDMYKDHMDVLIPKVPGHVFRIGGWMGEVELSPSSHGAHGHAEQNQPGPDVFELQGVEPGNATLAPEHNLIFHDKTLKAGKKLDDLLRAKLLLRQLPDKIV